MNIISEMGRAMALETDASFMWLGLEEHIKIYAEKLFYKKYIEDTKPKCIPQWLWLKLHNITRRIR